MKRAIVISLVFLSCIGTIFSQEKAGCIFGIVKDSRGEAVRDLTVFIPFTSVGTTTNSQGEYRLTRVPEGNIELVFRHISYKPLTKNMFYNKNDKIELNVSLESSVVELDEIVKKADPANWKYGFGMFKRFVLGDSDERLCKVENPEDIFFYYDGNKLTAHAAKPLIIENTYLGYKMTYFLDYFWYSQDQAKPGGTIGQASFAFSGSALYTRELDGNSIRKKIWMRNRETEYKGTLRHFLQALYSGDLREKGYQIKESWTSIREMQESKNLSPALALARSMEMEKRFYWDKNKQKSINLYYIPGEDYDIKSKIKVIENDMKAISMDCGLMVFQYWNSNRGIDEPKLAYFDISKGKSGKKSELIINSEGKYILEEGEIIWDYLDTTTKLATALPMDYIPDRF